MKEVPDGIDWGDVFERLCAYGMGRMRLNPADAEQVAQEALRRFLDPAYAAWDRAKEPNLLRHLGSIFNGIVRDMRTKRAFNRERMSSDGAHPDADDPTQSQADRLVLADQGRRGRELVDRAVREGGADPEAVRARGTVFVAQLKEQQRLAWQDEARRRRDAMRERASKVAVPPGMTRDQMLRRLNELRGNPRFGAPILTAFRKRKPEESSDEDLRALLEDIEGLRALQDDDHGDDDDDTDKDE